MCQVVTEFAQSWNQTGMPGFSDLLSEDTDFVVITGKWLKGRSEIVTYHKALLEIGRQVSRCTKAPSRDQTLN